MYVNVSQLGSMGITPLAVPVAATVFKRIFGRAPTTGPAWNRLQPIRVGQSWEPNMVAVDQKAVDWINPSWRNDLVRGVAGSVIWRNAPPGAFQEARRRLVQQITPPAPTIPGAVPAIPGMPAVAAVMPAPPAGISELIRSPVVLIGLGLVGFMVMRTMMKPATARR